MAPSWWFGLSSCNGTWKRRSIRTSAQYNTGMRIHTRISSWFCQQCQKVWHVRALGISGSRKGRIVKALGQHVQTIILSFWPHSPKPMEASRYYRVAGRFPLAYRRNTMPNLGCSTLRSAFMCLAVLAHPLPRG